MHVSWTYLWSRFLHISFFDIISCDPGYELGEHTHKKVCHLIQACFSVLFLSKQITVNFGFYGWGCFWLLSKGKSELRRNIRLLQDHTLKEPHVDFCVAFSSIASIHPKAHLLIWHCMEAGCGLAALKEILILPMIREVAILRNVKTTEEK